MPSAFTNSTLSAANGPASAPAPPGWHLFDNLDFAVLAVPLLSLQISWLLTLLSWAVNTPLGPFRQQIDEIARHQSSPDFKAYSKPSEPITEWIALGDSYTSGIGCNGDAETLEPTSNRGNRSFPMQMSRNHDRWARINHGNDTLPRFTFSAFTGDKVDELAKKQLVNGSWAEGNPKQPRPPFGAPQIAVMTIGGNDASLSDILDACVYRSGVGYWLPDCHDLLKDVKKTLDSGDFRRTMASALFKTAVMGREEGGAIPPESFQVYVSGYPRIFNEDDSTCDDISWAFPWNAAAPLTRDLRKQLNDLTRQVNNDIRRAALKLKDMGIIWVEGYDEVFENHRYCEPEVHYEMDSFGTWFWSWNNNIANSTEGPDDPANAGSLLSARAPARQLLEFACEPQTIGEVETGSLPCRPRKQWDCFDELLADMRTQSDVAISAVPLNYMRTFHPKGTAHSRLADLFFDAIVKNRG